MDWYVNANGQTYGPYDDARVIEWIRAGQMRGAKVCQVGSQEWTDPAAYPPFATALLAAAPPPPPPPPQVVPPTVQHANAGEGLGYLILLLPLASTVLIWVWVGSMNLLQDPGTTLTMLGMATVLATSVLIAIEASQLGMGKAPVEKGKVGNGPIAWFLATLLIWLIAFPLYLSKRRWYGKQSLAIGGTLVMLVFVGSWVTMGRAIDEKRDEIRQQLRGLNLPQ